MIEEKEHSALSPVEIGGVTFKSRAMYGAGILKTVEQVKAAVKSRAAALTVGSITVPDREGNSGKVVDLTPDRSLNSIGLRNGGLPYYKRNLPEIVKIAHDAGLPVFVNTAAVESLEDYGVLGELVAESGADGLETNVACPNVWDSKDAEDQKIAQKRIVGFVPEMIGEVLRILERSVGPDFWHSMKLPPYSDPDLLIEVANVLASADFINAVVTSNTFPNAFAFDSDGEKAITFGKGLAGMAGKGIRPIVMGQVLQLREVLPEHQRVIAIGGIGGSRKAVEDYLRVGADMTQITTGWHMQGNKVFGRVLSSRNLEK